MLSNNANQLIAAAKKVIDLRDDDMSEHDRVLFVDEGIDMLRQALAAFEAQAEPWVPVTERLPDDPQDCVFYSDDLRNPVPMSMGLYINGKFKCAGFEMVNVTHWMPLPQPPKENPNG